MLSPKEIEELANEMVLKIDKEKGMPISVASGWVEGFILGYNMCLDNEC